MSFKGWKKVKSEKDHTIMRDNRGHELKIAHSALTPKMRGQLAEIQVHSDDEETPQNFAEGGITKQQHKQSMVDAYNEGNGGPKVVKPNPLKPAAPASNIHHISSTGSQPGPSSPKDPNEGLLNTLRKANKDREDAKKPKQEAPKPAKKEPQVGETYSATEPQAKAHGGEIQKLAYGTPEEGIQDITQEPDLIPGVRTSASNPTAYNNEVQAKLDAPVAFPTPDSMLMAAPDVVAEQASDPDALPITPMGEEAAAPEATAPAPGIAPEETPAPAPASLPTGIPSGLGGGNPSAGIDAEAKAQGELGKQKAAIYDKAMAAQTKAAADNEKVQNELLTEMNAVRADVKNGHLDPDRYMSSLSTGKRIATTIGLILGGIGGGMTGKGNNLALEMLNHNIDRDLEAQKSEMGNKQNLLGMLDKQYGNLQVAQNVARAVMQDRVIAELSKAESLAMDPIAKARAQQAKDAYIAQQRAALAPTAALINVQNLAKAAEADPERGQEYIDQMQYHDPKRAAEYQQRFVPGLGFASSTEGATKIRELSTAVSGAKKSLERLSEINKIPFKSMKPEVRAEADSIAKGLVGMLRIPYTGPGALNEGEKQLLTDITGNPTAIFSLSSVNQKRLDTLRKDMDGKMRAAAASQGVKMKSAYDSLPKEQRRIADIARKNPNNPASKLALKKLGLD